MKIEQLVALGVTVVAGQVDFRNRTIGRCTLTGKIEFTDETAEAELNAMLAEAVVEPEPAPTPAPAAKKAAKKAAEKAPEAPAPAPATEGDDLAELGDILGS